VFEQIREARVAVEALPRSQTDEDLARTPLQPPLQLYGVVSRVEDEQGDGALRRGSAEQGLDLLGGNHVCLPIWMDAQDIHRGRPALANEAELSDELVGPEQATMGCPAEWREGW
jgi:hypothetical protein